ncbi:DNA repair protein RadA/Sms [Mumia flava]|uniref:DNA repair protein RadA n=1 Tax=Mumia flava TaxID=1348852 RepID=A0A0B2BUM8_9ACTN|nr:DNA repair protein RadA [Mumia flava]PJJ58153.1 DNA repair protein RadA/Sms [Mumia flava]
MAKTTTTFRCAECGWSTTKWVGRCGECQAWGTVDQAGGPSPSRRTTATSVSRTAQPIAQIDVEASRARSTAIGELDRVLGGGLVPGAVVLLAGEPGVGKSTLLLELAARWARSLATTLYVSGEESTSQIRLRADRTRAVHDSLYLAAETDLGAVLAHIDEVDPSLLVLDSVQTVGSSSVDGIPGGVTQVREVASTLVQVAKARNIPTILVGHVTKDGSIAGPRVLEHLVDVVLHFEGERDSRLRLVRAVKNRFGPVDEIGCFDLADHGIVEVPDPTGLFVSRHQQPVSGTCVTVTMEGRRPLLAEVQALVSTSEIPQPRRATSGLDPSRLAMILAVLSRRCSIHLAKSDVYAATVGGARLREPSADLATALAVASSTHDVVVPTDVVALGEVGLAGEVRRVAHLEQRLRECARLGFRRAIVPQDGSSDLSGLEALDVIRVADLAAALRAIGVGR